MFKIFFKVAWRNLYRKKVISFLNIIGLSLGFACSILIFLFVNHHLEYENFHKNSSRIFRIVTEQNNNGSISHAASVPPGFANAFKNDYNYAEKVAKIMFWGKDQISYQKGSQKTKFKESIAFAEEDFFKILDFPLLDGGNAISLAEPNTAVITENVAKTIFGAENPINKTFQLGNQESIRIVGILKDIPTNTFLESQIFVSFNTLPKYDDFSGSEAWTGINSDLKCFVLLRPNQEVSQIENELSQYVDKFRPTNKNLHHYKLQPLEDIHFNTDYSDSGAIDLKVLGIFSLIGFFLLIVACINFINISTAQSIHRSKEIGIRKVMGSFKGQLFWQFLTETSFVALLALIVGFVMSAIALPYFNNIFNLELALEELLTLKFFSFVCILLLAVAFLAGSYPGILISRIAPVMALKGKVTEKDSGGTMTRKVLVVTQFTISIILIIGTIIISKQIKYASSSDLGFAKSGIVMVNLPEALDFVRLESLKSRMEQYPGVEKISACFDSPGGGVNDWGTGVAYNNNAEQEPFMIKGKTADHDYLNTFDLDLVAGRNFYASDSVQGILVNETFAKKMGLAPTELLRKPISLSGGYIEGNIVGVIADFHDQNFHEDINPIFIAPQRDSYSALAIKLNMENAEAALKQIEKEWSGLFENYIFDFDFLDDRVAQQYKSEQEFLTLTKVFSILAIIIGCLGIYGLVLFFVGQKKREIGIRKVLGSNVTQILILVAQDFLKLIVIAGLIASPLAWYFMNRWLESFKYKTEISWWVFCLAIFGLCIITLITISYQAIKAARANPVKSLRAD